MELTDYLRIVRRRWVSILVIAVLCVSTAVALTLMATPKYASDVRLFVSTSQDSTSAEAFQGSQFSTQRVKSYVELASSRELAESVINRLELDRTANELISTVTAEAVTDTVLLQITVTDVDPHDAQRIAQAYAEAMVDMVREIETPTGSRTPPVKASIIDPASFSDSPVSPDPVRNIGLGLVLGLLLGFGLAVLRETMDTRVRTSGDLATVSEAPLLGTIGYDTNAAKTPLLSQIGSHDPRAEAFRVLRTNLQFVDVDSTHKVFVVSSAVPEEGKTSTSVNLAISLAMAGVRTLLIEADLRRPQAVGRLGLDSVVGVTSVLVGRVELGDAIQTHAESGLDVIASGPIPPNPAELLQSNAMSKLLNEVRLSYDVVILDAPPLLPVTDAALLAAASDGAILVARHGKVTKDQLTQSVERLEQVDAALVGVVLNMAPTKGRGSYGYGYGYGYAPEGGRRKKHVAEKAKG